jgi:hypothetical protein
MIPMMVSGNVKIHLQFVFNYFFIFDKKTTKTKTIMQITIGKFQALSHQSSDY